MKNEMDARQEADRKRALAAKQKRELLAAQEHRCGIIAMRRFNASVALAYTTTDDVKVHNLYI